MKATAHSAHALLIKLTMKTQRPAIICRVRAVCHATPVSTTLTSTFRRRLQICSRRRRWAADQCGTGEPCSGRWWCPLVSWPQQSAHVRLTHHQQLLNQAAATAARSLCCCCYFWQTLIKRDYFYLAAVTVPSSRYTLPRKHRTHGDACCLFTSHLVANKVACVRHEREVSECKFTSHCKVSQKTSMQPSIATGEWVSSFLTAHRHIKGHSVPEMNRGRFCYTTYHFASNTSHTTLWNLNVHWDSNVLLL